MKKTKLSILLGITFAFLFALPGFAAELNSGNITQAPYNCSTGATICSLSGVGITSIASGTFINHPILERLDLSNNEISEIVGAFSGLTNLEKIDLSNNGISEIVGAFSGLTNLKYLVLEENGISEIVGAFSGLTNLKSIYLSNNEISEIVGAFSGLTNLVQIKLLNNEISEIVGAFSGLTNLNFLYLSNNEISEIASGSFKDLNSLIIFSIDNNKLCTGTLAQSIIDWIDSKNRSTEWQATQDTTNCPVLGCTDLDANNYNSGAMIDDGTCTYDVGLLCRGNVTTTYGCSTGATFCDINSDGITSIASGTFVNHTNLNDYLNLNSNSLTGIEKGAFNGLSDLQTLALFFNNIDTIEIGAFDGLNNLKYLDLYHNNFSILKNGSFHGLTNLLELSLYHNNITTIESGAFSGLVNLTDLMLDNNSLTTIEDGTFSGLSNLNYLGLSSNNLTSIGNGTFSGLSNLETLDLEGNQISTIENQAFNTLVNLGEIYLYENNLTHIESGTFHNLENLRYLELYANPITEIETGAFDGLNNLIYLYLNNLKIKKLTPGMFQGLGVNLEELLFNDWGYDNIGLPAIIEEVETGTFDNLTGLTSFSLADNKLLTLPSSIFDKLENIDTNYVIAGNCIDTTTVFTHTGIQSNGREDYQAVCPIFQYTPITQTAGPVTGELIFAGGKERQRDSLNQKYSGHTHVWTENGIHVFVLTGSVYYSDGLDDTPITSEVIDLGEADEVEYIHRGAFTVTGEVTRIGELDTEAPVVNGTEEGKSYTTSVTFTVTDNVAVTSVILDEENLTERTGITITEIGDHTIIAQDVAGNTTTVNFTIKKKSSGGGGGSMSKDFCPDGDFSPSYYDNECGPDEQTDSEEVEETNEMEEAYNFAKENEITTTTNIDEFNTDGKLIRKEMAKMVSKFATDVLGKTELSEGVEDCDKFQDLEGQTQEMKDYIVQSCKLGLMGRESDQKDIKENFDPEEEVTRGQFGTVLSRLLRGDKYAIEDGTIFYEEHLNALKENGIMTIIDPTIKELRGRVLLMLYRVEK